MEWSPPVNLGKAINSSGRDWGYRVSTDGSTAFFAVDVPGKKEDLFQTQLPEDMRPEAVTILSGKITNPSDQPIDAKILIEDLETGEQIGLVHPDPITGEYFVTLPIGKRYSYIVLSENHYPLSNNIDLREKSASKTYEEDIKVPSIEEMAKESIALPLNNLFFETNQFKIESTSYPELNRLAQVLKMRTLHLQIAGHTDDQGGAAYNQELSYKRADAVKQYLLEKGCDKDKIEAQGFGMSQPLNDNDTEEGRAMNRRVEIRFINPQ